MKRVSENLFVVFLGTFSVHLFFILSNFRWLGTLFFKSSPGHHPLNPRNSSPRSIAQKGSKPLYLSVFRTCFLLSLFTPCFPLFSDKVGTFRVHFETRETHHKKSINNKTLYFLFKSTTTKERL